MIAGRIIGALYQNRCHYESSEITQEFEFEKYSTAGFLAFDQ